MRVLDDMIAAWVTAILVESVRLLRVLGALAVARGLQIPDELSLVLLADDTATNLSAPHEWAALRIPGSLIDRRAVDLLLDELTDPEGDHDRQILMPCNWTLEGSVAPRS